MPRDVTLGTLGIEQALPEATIYPLGEEPIELGTIEPPLMIRAREYGNDWVPAYLLSDGTVKFPINLFEIEAPATVPRVSVQLILKNEITARWIENGVLTLPISLLLGGSCASSLPRGETIGSLTTQDSVSGPIWTFITVEFVMPTGPAGYCYQLGDTPQPSYTARVTLKQSIQSMTPTVNVVSP